MEKEIQMFEMFDEEAQERRRRQIKNYNMLHEMDKKDQELIERENRLNKLRKIKIYTGIAVLAATTVISLKKYSDYVEKPIQIVTYDIMANEGFALSDDGRRLDPKKFSLEDEDKLYEYVKNKNLSSSEIKESISSYAKKNNFDENMILGKVKEDYPELFPSIEEIHKTR